jgi:hypothetical protein
MLAALNPNDSSFPRPLRQGATMFIYSRIGGARALTLGSGVRAIVTARGLPRYPDAQFEYSYSLHKQGHRRGHRCLACLVPVVGPRTHNRGTSRSHPSNTSIIATSRTVMSRVTDDICTLRFRIRCVTRTGAICWNP